MPAQRETLEETIDRLYSLPLDEFTAARDAAAKERRAEKDRDGAETLRELRKPNLVAWSLNRVSRSEPAAVEGMIAAGERLSEAQRNLVLSGERGSLREAAADERAEVGRVAALAAAELSAAGHPAEAGIESKLFATLHAAASNDEVRQQLALGRLVRDHELSDLGLGDAALLSAPPKAPPAKATRAKAARAKAPPKRGASNAGKKTSVAPKQTAAERAWERKRQAVSDRIARAKERHEELAGKAEAARRAARDADRAARDADRAARDADRAARDADRAARQAAKELERARGAAEKAADATERAAKTVKDLEAELAALG